MDNFYVVLGCSESASYEEIKKCYQELVRKSHPDKTTSTAAGADYFIKVNEAWQTLRDPVKRKTYDAQLLVEQCENELVLYATVTLQEMTLDGSVYCYPCRCGSFYSVPKDECVKSNCDLYEQ